MVGRRYILWLWVAIMFQLLGRGLDRWWHATNDELERTSQQYEVIAGAVAAVVLARRSPSPPKPVPG
jgi:hypothetical protein